MKKLTVVAAAYCFGFSPSYQSVSCSEHPVVPQTSDSGRTVGWQ